VIKIIVIGGEEAFSEYMFPVNCSYQTIDTYGCPDKKNFFKKKEKKPNHAGVARIVGLPNAIIPINVRI
jgi:hypothetical protein